MAVLSKSATSLRIFGDNLEPTEITKLLGKEPDRAYRKGDEVPVANGTTRVARTGSWSVSVDRKSPGDLDAQITEILDGTSEDLGHWRYLASRFQVEMFCGLFLEEWNEGLSVSAATSTLLGSRGISLELDVYCHGEN
ncbi:MAG: DUF4279 domain-containing protein [Gammaproteobacteria bacterium]|nr:DUF4279 domain-containing protein [Gammaproteobacteria bacterium]